MPGRDSGERRLSGRRLGVVALVCLALVLLTAAAATALATRGTPPDGREQRVLPPPQQQPLQRTLPVRPHPQRVRVRTARPPASRQLPLPVRIRIPAIGVSAPFVRLGLNRDRTLQVPRRTDAVGWFVGGPEPGEVGAAVIAGHVDSRSGPAVFYHLRALRRGDRIGVELAGGARASFVVTGTKQVEKRSFPERQVYRRTAEPTLRLITCDGRFDRSTRHYVDNFIVFARLERFASN
jgi:LPXTG-site transpeptidase (sortase) family protein